jgi:hypothetical protein
MDDMRELWTARHDGKHRRCIPQHHRMMAEETAGKRSGMIAIALIIAGVIPLMAGLIDLLQGDGIRWVAFAAGLLLIAAGWGMRGKEKAIR